MSIKLSKQIAAFDYFDKYLIVLSATSGGISTASFASVSVSFSFSSTEITKKLFKTAQNKKKNHNKIVMLARSKLNSIQSKIPEALLNNEISHEDYETFIDEERNYHEPKGSIRMMKSQRSDTEKNNLTPEGKRIEIDTIIKHNEIINNNFKALIIK